MIRNAVTFSDVDALDYDDEPIYLAPYDAQRLAKRSAQIDAQTPQWVRRCRALGHHVVLMTGPPQKCTWLCTRCGKDRKER